MDLRRAQDSDAGALTQLIDAAYQPYRDAGVALPDVSGGIAEAISAGEVWVIGAPVQGVLMIRLTPPNAHLMNVAVATSAKGQGIGGVLIRHGVALAQEAGCTAVDLATHRDLADNIALYTHLGWQECGRDGMRVMMTRAL